MAETAMILLKIQKGKASENLSLAHFFERDNYFVLLSVSGASGKTGPHSTREPVFRM